MNSQVCVDASLITRILIPDSLTENALALYAQWKMEQVSLIAPTLLAYEVISGLRRYVYFKRIQPSQGEKAFLEYLQMDVRLSHQEDIFPLAWDLAKQFNRPRAYDTAYLAVAQLNNCEFWTADEKLYNAVRHELSWVHWIGNHPSGGNGKDTTTS